MRSSDMLKKCLSMEKGSILLVPYDVLEVMVLSSVLDQDPCLLEKIVKGYGLIKNISLEDTLVLSTNISQQEKEFQDSL